MSFSVMEKQLWASLSFQLGGGCTRRDNLAHSIFRSLGGGASRVSYQSTQLYLRGHCDVLWCVSDGRCSKKRVRIMWNLPAEGFQTGLHVTPSSNSVIPPNLSLLNCELRIKEFLAHAPKGCPYATSMQSASHFTLHCFELSKSITCRHELGVLKHPGDFSRYLMVWLKETFLFNYIFCLWFHKNRKITATIIPCEYAMSKFQCKLLYFTKYSVANAKRQGLFLLHGLGTYT